MWPRFSSPPGWLSGPRHAMDGRISAQVSLRKRKRLAGREDGVGQLTLCPLSELAARGARSPLLGAVALRLSEELVTGALVVRLALVVALLHGPVVFLLLLHLGTGPCFGSPPASSAPSRLPAPRLRLCGRDSIGEGRFVGGRNPLFDPRAGGWKRARWTGPSHQANQPSH